MSNVMLQSDVYRVRFLRKVSFCGTVVDEATSKQEVSGLSPNPRFIRAKFRQPGCILTHAGKT